MTLSCRLCSVLGFISFSFRHQIPSLELSDFEDYLYDRKTRIGANAEAG
jgi:hypothetical protein